MLLSKPQMENTPTTYDIMCKMGSCLQLPKVCELLVPAQDEADLSAVTSTYDTMHEHAAKGACDQIAACYCTHTAEC